MGQKKRKEQKTLRLLGFGGPSGSVFQRERAFCVLEIRPKTLRLLGFGALEALVSQRERKNPFPRGVWVISEKNHEKKNSIIGIFFSFFLAPD